MNKQVYKLWIETMEENILHDDIPLLKGGIFKSFDYSQVMCVKGKKYYKLNSRGCLALSLDKLEIGLIPNWSRFGGHGEYDRCDFLLCDKDSEYSWGSYSYPTIHLEKIFTKTSFPYSIKETLGLPKETLEDIVESTCQKLK